MRIDYCDKFEYVLVDLSGKTYKFIINELNKLGKEGWEVISSPEFIEDGFVSKCKILLKRKIMMVQS